MRWFGDNGIISNAQNANIKSGIASLEEFLQEEYVENYDKFNNNESKVVQLQNIHQGYFYIPSNEGIGSLRYIVDSNGHALYLIKKSGLPKEIRDGLVGGNAGEGKYSDYATLNDVYGVTSDLKVYYSAGNGTTLVGISNDELDNDNPLRTVFSNSSAESSDVSWYNLLEDYDLPDKDGNKDGKISAEEVKSVKTLTIDSSSGVSNLSGLYNLNSLQELTIENKTLASLDGIQDCTNLYYFYNKGSVIENYSALANLGSKLRYLYFYNIDDTELNNACSNLSNAEFCNLEYFAVVGEPTNISIASVKKGAFSSVKSDKTITSLQPLSKLSKTTKEKIKYLSLQNNNITDIVTNEQKVFNLSYIKDFINVYLLRIEFNKIYSLSGIENFSNLTYLIARDNLLGTNLDGSTQENLYDSISALTNKSKLYFVYLTNNYELKQVDYFKNDSNIRYLYLDGCSKLMTVNNISNIIDKCILNGNTYALPVKYLNGSIYKISEYYNPSIATYEELYSDLYGNTTIEAVWLDSNKVLTNEQLNTILGSMSKLSFVSLNNTNMQTLEFMSQKSKGKIRALILSDTNVTDLTGLKDSGNTLRYLKVNNANTNFTGLDTYLGNISTYSIADDMYIGLEITNQQCLNNLVSQINPSSLILSPRVSSVNLTTWTKLTKLNFRGSGSTILSLNFLTNGTYWLENCESIKVGSMGNNVTLQFYNPIKTDYGWQDFWSSLDGKTGDISIIQVQRPEYIKFNYDFTKGGISVNTLEFNTYTSDKKTDFTYFNGINNLKYFYDTKSSGVKVSDLVKHTSLQVIVANGNDISSLEGIETLTNLKRLDLSNNKISNLIPLKNMKSLNYLNLENNCIYDTSSYVDLTGKTITYNNLQILGDLNVNSGKGGNLNALYLNGNAGIIDYSPVLSLSWTGGKSGF